MSASDVLRVGVIGVGHLGKNHARVYTELDNVELIGVVDRTEERAREVVGGLIEKDPRNETIRAVDNVQEIMDDIDAVSIVVPTPQHMAVCEELIQAGKHVLVEKPMAATIEEADRIIELAEKHGVTLQVGHIERFNPVLNAALPYIQDPLFIECDRIHPFNLRSTDVSVVFDLMIHDIDLILHMIDSRVEDVDAVGARVLSPTEDISTARILFENGCFATVKTSRVAVNRSRKIRIFCAQSYISLDLIGRTGVRVALRDGYDPQQFLDDLGRISAPEGEAAFLAENLQQQHLEITNWEPLKVELESFVDAVRSGSEPKVTGLQGRRAMVAANAIEESMKEHYDRVASRLKH